MTLSRAAIAGHSAVARLAAYAVLTKPDVTFLVILTTLAGFYLASPGILDSLRLAATLFGTAMMAAGTAALNHYIERHSDAQMRRTAHRPLPAGLLSPTEAMSFGLLLTLCGGVYLAWQVNGLSALLGFLTTALYLGLYTPLKRCTVHALTVGSFPGAIPPLIGWAAARGHLDRGAWILFTILFLWQFPHVLAIDWIYRQDYARAGMRVLPAVDRTGSATFAVIIWTTMAMVLGSLMPSVTGLTGITYFFYALICGMAVLQVCLWAARHPTNQRVRWILRAMDLYLPAVLIGMMLGRTG